MPQLTISDIERAMSDANNRIVQLYNALVDVREQIRQNAGLRNEYQDWTEAESMIEEALKEPETR